MRSTSALSAAILALTLTTLMAACGTGTGVRNGDGDDRESISASTRSVPLPNDINWSALTVNDGVVFLVGVTTDPNAQYNTPERALIAIDANSGETLFRSTFDLPPAGFTSYSFDLVATDSAVIYRTEQTLSALSREDGVLLWEQENTDVYNQRIAGVEADTVYIYTPPNNVRAIDSRTGTTEAYEMTGYQNLFEAWLSEDGRSIIGQANPDSDPYQIAVVSMELAPGAAPVQISATPQDGNNCFFGPILTNLSGQNVYGRSNYVVSFKQRYESIDIEVESALDPKAKPIWKHQITFSPDSYYDVGCYRPNLSLNGSQLLVQRPNAQGILLNNVLHLQLRDLHTQRQRWTNILPTNGFVDATYRFGDHVVIHTQPNSSGNARWHLFSTQTGTLLWSSDVSMQSGSNTRGLDASPQHLVRLTTTDWINGTLVIDSLDLD